MVDISPLKSCVDALFFINEQRIYSDPVQCLYQILWLYFRILTENTKEFFLSFRLSTWTSWKMWKKSFSIVTQFRCFFFVCKMISIVLLFRWKFRSSFHHNSSRLLYCGCVKVKKNILRGIYKKKKITLTIGTALARFCQNSGVLTCVFRKTMNFIP